MKAFISYSHKDGNMVTGIAQALGSVLGQENVFFDAWSIQPGDGIIDRMNMGLSDCDFFFFFVSKASLNQRDGKDGVAERSDGRGEKGDQVHSRQA